MAEVQRKDVTACAVSPNCRYMAVVGADSPCVYTLPLCEEAAEVSHTPDRFDYACSFCPHSKLLAVGSYRKIILYDVQAKKTIKEIQTDDIIHSCSFG